MDAATARRYIQTGAHSNTTGTATISPDYGAGSQVAGSATTQTSVHHTALQDTTIVIAGTDMAFTVNDSVQKAVGLPMQGIARRAIANRNHGCQYIVGDQIEYAQEKNSLWVKDANGKECKLDILRQERVPAPSQ
jgi:hypothetical protein